MLMNFEEHGGVPEVAPLKLATFGLDGAELVDSLLELAGETMAEETEAGEEPMGVDDIEIDGGLLVGRIGGAGEQLRFEERHAVEAPSGVREFVDELGLGGGGGAVLIEKLLEVALEGGRVLGGQDGGLSGQAMPERVQRRSLLAGLGAGAGRIPGVGAIDGGAIGSWSGCGGCHV